MKLKKKITIEVQRIFKLLFAVARDSVLDLNLTFSTGWLVPSGCIIIQNNP
jgi:hypothetical protein